MKRMSRNITPPFALDADEVLFLCCAVERKQFFSFVINVWYVGIRHRRRQCKDSHPFIHSLSDLPHVLIRLLTCSEGDQSIQDPQDVNCSPCSLVTWTCARRFCDFTHKQPKLSTGKWYLGGESLWQFQVLWEICQKPAAIFWITYMWPCPVSLMAKFWFCSVFITSNVILIHSQ